MPIDPSIAMGFKAPEFEAPVNALAKMLQVQTAQQQNQLGQAKLDEHQRGVEKDQRRQNILAGFLPGMSIDDQAMALTRGGFVTDARTIVESGAKVSKDQREAEKAQREAEKFDLDTKMQKAKRGAQILGSAKDQASYDAARETAQAEGLDVSRMPPQFDAAFVQAKQKEALTVQEQYEQHWKAKGYDLELKKAGETARHNGAVERTAAGQLGVAQTREKREASAPRGQVVQTDAGPILVDPHSGTGTPVTVGGKAVPAKGSGQAAKDAQSVIDLLDQADPLLETATHSLVGAGYDRTMAAFGKSTEGAQSAATLKALEGALIAKQPKMTGPQSDKDVLLYRQMAGQIGDASLPIETRRAAMRGVREMAKKTLGQPTAPTTPTKPGALPARNSKGWALMTDAQGNRAYVSPDKTQHEEVH